MNRPIVICLMMALTACGSDANAPEVVRPGVEHLNARPQAGVTTAAAGTYVLSVSAGVNCCVLQIPQTAAPADRLPLVVMLHGAGFTEEAVATMLALGEELDFAVLAPRSSARGTWDVIYDTFGVDVARIDAALVQTFQRINVDPLHIAIAGFSDGASYALMLGLANGDLFTHVIAFSPGYLVPVPRIGKPRFFVANGRQEGYPFSDAERLFVSFLRTLGYAVEFEAFDGGHKVDEATARHAITWLASGS